MLIACAGCDKPILDKFLLNVLERTWHSDCVRCFDCHIPLADKCFSREGKLFCRSDFFRRYGTKCGGCGQGISPSDLVRKARDKVFHLNCFTCLVCRKQLSTGEELYVLDDNKFICKDDYLSGNKASLLGVTTHHQGGSSSSSSLSVSELSLCKGLAPSDSVSPTFNFKSNSLMGSASEDDDDDDNSTASSSVLKHHHPLHGSLPPVVGSTETNNNSLTHSDLGQDSKTGQDDSEDQNSLDGDADLRDSQTENKSPDDSGAGSKRRGPRTTIKAKQLEILKTAFSQTPKPTRHIREQLAKETGLPMRVIQVWFQNKRSKERRLKQLTSMGRGPFFGGSRKMRGFPMNLSPGGGLVDDGPPPPGFAYFADGKFDFGGGGGGGGGGNYGPMPAFHPHDGGPPFFHAHPHHHHHPHHPHHHGPFGPGMEHDFGGGDPPTVAAAAYLGQQSGPPPPPPQQQQMEGGGPPPPPPPPPASGRSGSPPDFVAGGGGGAAFSDNPQQLNEGLVW